MSEEQKRSERAKAIHLLRSGLSLTQVSERLQRSVGWVHKWKQRYDQEGWSGLEDRSRKPKSNPNAYAQQMRQLICQIRSELEAQAEKTGLCFIGAPTIHSYLCQRLPKGERIPSISTIERILVEAGLTHPQSSPKPPVIYPKLQVTRPHQIHQLDIVPHHLSGGQSVACFNAIDAFSRYPTGQSRLRKTSQDAAHFLIKMWRDLGIATYTQMDNEACFSGGTRHPCVIGKVVRLCLMVNTQPLFIPIRHPKSNAIIERFHQTYNRHIWHRYDLQNLASINAYSQYFFETYRQNHYHSAFHLQTPVQVHQTKPVQHLPDDFKPNLNHLPITNGCIHFLRKVETDGCVSILNHRWQVTTEHLQQGVWATLQLVTTQDDGILTIYDAPPNTPHRQRLAQHRFPLAQPVVPLHPAFIRTSVPQPFPVSLLDRFNIFIRHAFTMS